MVICGARFASVVHVALTLLVLLMIVLHIPRAPAPAHALVVVPAPRLGCGGTCTYSVGDSNPTPTRGRSPTTSSLTCPAGTAITGGYSWYTEIGVTPIHASTMFECSQINFPDVDTPSPSVGAVYANSSTAWPLGTQSEEFLIRWSCPNNHVVIGYFSSVIPGSNMVRDRFICGTLGFSASLGSLTVVGRSTNATQAEIPSSLRGHPSNPGTDFTDLCAPTLIATGFAVAEVNQTANNFFFFNGAQLQCGLVYKSAGGNAATSTCYARAMFIAIALVIATALPWCATR